jgi:hypothetical protein
MTNLLSLIVTFDWLWEKSTHSTSATEATTSIFKLDLSWRLLEIFSYAIAANDVIEPTFSIHCSTTSSVISFTQSSEASKMIPSS